MLYLQPAVRGAALQNLVLADTQEAHLLPVLGLAAPEHIQ